MQFLQMQKSSVLVLFFCFSSVLAYVPVAMNCPNGWKWFKRSRGGWCMRVYEGSMTQADAEAKCQAEGAVLAGVQNNPEAEWMGKSLQSLISPNIGSMWIGAKRTIPCKDSGLTKQCSQITSFYWTDGSTVGVQGFQWNAGEPNNAHGGQSCVHLSAQSNNMDDLGCNEITPKGYVCGKVAKFD